MPVVDLETLALESPAEVDQRPLAPEDRTRVDYYNLAIQDRVAAVRLNAWVEVTLPPTPLSIVRAVKQEWEVRGHGVGVFGLPGGGYRIVLSPRPAVVSLPLPSLTVVSGVKSTSCDLPRLLVRMPTRERPAQALAALALYRQMAGMPVAIEVVVDVDDESMLASDVLQRLCALDCVVTVGEHGSKVAAVNGGRVSEWDALLLASDDMVPTAYGYARRAVEALVEHFPHFDGAVFFDDEYAHGSCCTLPVMGRHLHDQFGYVYDPAYESLCCDVEQTELLRAMGRLAYVDEVLIEHRHPAAGKSRKDALYLRNDALHERDRVVYEARKVLRRPHAQFTFDSPPLALSICIATVPSRRAQLERLLDCVYGQIARDAPREVEVLVDATDRVTSDKRQSLLGRALGHYVAFVDDDDMVSHDYVDKVVTAIKENAYAADCLSLSGAMTTDGARVERFEHSLAHDRWYQRADGVHCRTPNHLNAVRRSLALAAGFPENVSHGEDREYARRLRPMLKLEAAVDGDIYHYWKMTGG